MGYCISTASVVELVKAAKADDREAFGELCRRYYHAVLAVVRQKIKDSHAAQDTTQNIFAHAMCKITQLREPEKFGFWLMQIARHMSLNEVTRRERVIPWDMDEFPDPIGREEDPIKYALRHEKKTQVWTGLDQLKPVDRATLVAFYIYGRSLKQISRELETPIGTIKRRLHVARNRLREHLIDMNNPENL